MSGPTNRTDDPSERPDAVVWAAEMVRKIEPIGPLVMRCAVLAEWLRDNPPERAAAAMAALVAGAIHREEPGWVATVECLVAVLGRPELVPYGARRTLYAAAKQRGHGAICRLFFDAAPGADAAARSAALPEREVVPRGRQLTLGERKSLARTHRRDVLAHVRRDPHPDVVAILLGNPHLTESDVLAMASRRPTSGACLATIAEHERWIARYAVKRALVRNPYTPLALAVRLTTTLRPSDLTVVAGDPALAAPVREHARDLLDA